MRNTIINIIILLFCVFPYGLIAQITDTIIFPISLSNDSAVDCSKQLNSIISKANPHTLISFKKGDYHFKTAIQLKSNISISGDDAMSVKFLFDLNGKGDLIQIKGTHDKIKFDVKEAVQSGVFEITSNASEVKPGSLIRLYKSVPTLELSAWAKESIGQIFEVVEVKNSIIRLKTSVRLDYSLTEKPMVEIIHPIENVCIANVTIERKDKSTYQTSNILFSYARYCSLENVVSKMTNFAHVSIDYSKQVEIKHVDFYNSFSHGNGGNGYGVTLQYSSTDCLIQNCIFRKLRHAIVIQSGANGNVIAGNYSLEGFWEDVKLPKYSAGDIVLHGNYPYDNSIMGNVCNQIVVDKSHGLNGYNLILKNRLIKYGIFVQRHSIDVVTIRQNDLVKSKCFQGKIRGSKKEMSLIANRRNSKEYKSKAVDNLICKPFKDGERIIYSIGYPCDFANFYNAAYFRYNSSLISTFN